ncbi:hypothetical protein MRB53_040887 [Persea americana]|nr:hypothetical protein MRB53_040887 [Persea americana]
MSGPSLVDPKDLRSVDTRAYDGQAAPMSPALSVRMQQISLGPNSPHLSTSSSQYFEDGVERANVPRRERVRTSSQKSSTTISSPVIPLGTDTSNLDEVEAKTAPVPTRMQPVNEAVPSSRNSKVDGGPSR